MTTRWKQSGTTLAASAWVAVCAYLCAAWPSLAALLAVLGSIPPAPLRVPRIAFLALGLVAVVGLKVKDRWMSTSVALALDAVVGVPALLAIAYLLEPFLVPVE